MYFKKMRPPKLIVTNIKCSKVLARSRMVLCKNSKISKTHAHLVKIYTQRFNCNKKYHMLQNVKNRP